MTSAGKAWNLAGFKAGLIVAGAQATDVLAALPPLAQQSSGHLANLVHTAALEKAQDWVDELMAEIAANKALLATELARELPAARYTAPEGTYLAWVDCSELGLDNPARHFEEIGRVAFSPGVNFGKEHQQWVRINPPAPRAGRGRRATDGVGLLNLQLTRWRSTSASAEPLATSWLMPMRLRKTVDTRRWR